MPDKISFSESGVWESENVSLSSDAFRRLGAALGSRVEVGAKVLVSADSHELDSPLLQSLSEGLHGTGVEVVNLGFLPSPLIYYAARRIQVDALATVSRSYDYVSTDNTSPAPLCGLQWMIADRVPSRYEVQEIQAAFQDKSHEFRVCEDGPEKRFLDVTYDYVAWLQDTWFDSPGTKTHVVLGPQSKPIGSPWIGRARRYLQAVFTKLVFSETSPEQTSDKWRVGAPPAPGTAGVSPAHMPNYIESQTPLRATMQEVDHSRADLGFLFGQDGRQIQLVDGNGVLFHHDELNWLLVQSFGTSLEGETFLFDSRCSSAVLDAARAFGANLKEIAPGNPSFLRTMQETSALLGVESNGRHYFRAIRGYCDALFTICWILDFLAVIAKTPAQVRDDIPKATISPHIIIPWDESQNGNPEEFLQQFSQKWGDETVFDSPDGFRKMNGNGWIALGKAQPPDRSLILRMEATDPGHFEQMARRCCFLLDSLPYRYEQIRQLGSQIWTQYFEKILF